MYNTFPEQSYQYGRNNSYGPPRGHGHRSYPHRPTFNVKEVLVEQTFNAIKQGMELQNLWVDIRKEDEGFHTIRVHIKKKEDIAMAPLVIQKIVSEIGLTELSMHYLKRSHTDKKFGLTIYMRCRKNNADVLKVIHEFSQFKIHARRVREMPASMQSQVKVPQRKAAPRSSMLILKKNEPPKKHVLKPSRSQSKRRYVSKLVKRTCDFPDEDPDLEDESGDEVDAINRSRKAPSIVKPTKKKGSRTISVLVPDEQEEVISLKFENGTTKKIKMRMSSKSKSISKIEAEKSLRPRPSSTKIAKSWGSV